LVPRTGLQFFLDPSQPEQAHVRGQVHEQVHVAVGPVLAASHAAEDPQVGHIMSRSHCHQVSALSPDLPPHRTRQPAQLRRLVLDVHHEVASGGIDQLGWGSALTP
jgi:hypothetical protein